MEKFTLEEIKATLIQLALKELKSFYTFFKLTSPINESTGETLDFEEWYKTVEVTRDIYYLPNYITDNLSGFEIKELYKGYLKEKYNEFLKGERK